MTTLRRDEPPLGSADPVVHLTVRASLDAPAVARAFVRSGVELLGSSAPDDAVLLTSEVVTNSVVHADTDEVEVLLRRHGDAVHVAVTDSDPEQPEMQEADPTRVGGFGVRLIDELADDWGVDPLAGEGGAGKCVWFEVALVPGGPANA
ncbi:MAG: rsbU4 [Ilumatobacteraceae bacterium]|nr:rsbU4 [Ilumatobacteraceae bacterium]